MKFLSSTILMIVLVAAGWRYAPEHLREKLLGAVGIARRGDTMEIKHFIRDVVLPKNPEKRRLALTRELKKNIAELKRRLAAKNNGGAGISADDSAADASGTKLGAATDEELIGASGEIVKELEDANKDTSTSAVVTERVLDAILPSSRGSVECKVK